MDRCPGCGSDNIYFSKKRQVYVCEDCELEFAEERPEIQSKTIFFSYAHDENEWLVQKLKGDIEQRTNFNITMKKEIPQSVKKVLKKLF